MSIYVISYELKSEYRDYSEFYTAIKTIGEWQHPIDSIWFVKTDLNATAIYERIRKYSSEKDNILVSRVDISDMQGWLPRTFWNWINSNQKHD